MKNVVVAGGTKGIGAEIVRNALENGNRVFVYARQQDGLENHEIFISIQ
jgi:short-subunit dehydrogenase